MDRHASINRIYRLVWSHVHKTWVVVAETARGRGKKTNRKLLAASALAVATQLAHAGPTGGQVTAGSGSIHQSGNTTTINQSSQTLSLSWQSFNTNGGETVNVVQPSSSAIAVNRIFDTNGTQFMGKLNANGQVYLINPNGVLFGAGSQVNVGGLIASTLDIDDAALDGAARRFSGAGTGSIVNRGSITTPDGGYVAFVGNRVSNHGIIGTPTGGVALGSGSDVTLSFAGNSLVNMQVNRSTLDNLVENGGLIQADGGAVILTSGAKDAVLASVVNNTGIIQARTVENIDGTIVLGGGQQSTVSNGGTLDASGLASGQQGGTVKVLGDHVALAAGSTINVSGDAGGGTTLVGGNFLGAGPERNALTTDVAAGSAIQADAITRGNGGQVAVWSNDTTRFDGSISARGGAQAGDGGQVETSGHVLKVSKSAAVDTSAAHGTTGSWLLDPADITIGNRSSWDSSVNIDVDAVALTRALNTTDVTIKTTASLPDCTGVACTNGSSGQGDINILDAIGGVADFDDGGRIYNWISTKTLTLSAYRDIRFVTTRNATTAGGFGDVGGVIEVQGGGKVVLRTDNAGRGMGTIRFDDPNYSYIYADSASTFDIFYNPERDGNGTWIATDYNAYNLGNPGTLSTFMLVNFAANVGSKTYDGTTTASLNGLTILGGAPGDITIDTSQATANFQNKNAGSNKAVTISGIGLVGANANAYAINGLDNKTATIARADITVYGVTANNKTYDGTTAGTLAGTAAVNAFASDVVSVSGSGSAAFGDKNAGNAKAVTVSGYTLSGVDAANYTIRQPTGLSANIGKANLVVTGVTASNKTYDGTTVATLSGSATVAAFGADAVTVSGTGSASFANKNAGNGKLVNVFGYTLNGADAGNYNVVQPTGLVATIDKASLQLTGVSVSDKVYDGTTAATLSGTATVTPFSSDAVTLAGTATAGFLNKNAGAGRTVTVSGYSLSGADAGNYNIAQPTGLNADIAKADLAVSGITADNKTYDGTTAATLSGNGTVAAFGSDVVVVGGAGMASFADKNAGNGKLVNVSGYTLNGADAGNYNVVQPSGLTATIDKASLQLTGVSVSDKIYDGTTAATLSGTAGVTPFGTDQVALSGSGSAVFADRNAGSNKAANVSGFVLSGADAANYDLLQVGGLSATIFKADLVVGGVFANNKIYDGTTAATLSGTATVTPLGGDAVSLSGTATASFASKNAGAGRAVTVSGYSLDGADAGNYTIAQPIGLNADIGKASLTVTGITANNKTYDGTTTATLSGSASVAAFGADLVAVNGNASGNFADKNAGTGKAVAVSGYTLGGADAGNYTLVQPGGLSADIGKAGLALAGLSVADKVYDGTTAASLAGSAGVRGIGADLVGVSGSGAAVFADKNAGSGKAVIISGFTLSGDDAGNYTLLPSGGLSANIGKADLALSGLSARNRSYDGTTTATLSGTANVRPIGADVVTLGGVGVGAFSDKNAGNAKRVTVSGYTLSGTDAGNYNLVSLDSLSADITRASINVSGIVASDKVLDGTTAATADTRGVVFAGLFGTDRLTVASLGAFDDAGVGTGKVVRLTNTYGGPDIGNYDIATDQTTAFASITAAPVQPPVQPPTQPNPPVQPPIQIAPPVTPVTPEVQAPEQVRTILAQVQSMVLPPQASARPGALRLSSTLQVSSDDGKAAPAAQADRDAPVPSIITMVGAGVGAPRLQIQNGGMLLPPLASVATE